MKNIAVLTVLVIISGVYSYAEKSERNYCFSLGPQFGFVYGQALEYVYSLPEDTKNELLSELIWEMKPVFYLGLQAEFGRIDLMKAPGFFSSISFKAGISGDSGVMEDRDWLYPENSNLTRFSSHTNRTGEFFLLDASAGFSFPIKSFLYIKPFIGGSWMRFAFSGRNGYGVYNDLNPKEQDFSGEKVITYSQDWLILAIGFTSGTNILYPFIFDISFQISPLTYCSATDTHISRNTVFRDFTAWGLFFEPSLNMSFVVKPVEFSLVFSYRRIGKTRGESYTNANNAGFYLGKNKAGAGLSLFSSNFLVSIRL
ncbi:MAG: omptin family outer membrane protease [Treponema sp.]|nr:omptin family outer membrane protease [Treponema sp.]